MATVAMLLVLVACTDEKVGSVYQVFNDNPASNTLAADSTCTEWVKILRYADLYNALNQATEDFTVLVPDNNAVAAFYASKNVSSIEDLGKSYARALILHHTVLDSLRVEKMQLKTKLTNLDNSSFSVAIDPEHAGQFIFGGVAHTTASGVHSYNALLYYIDAVMIPLVETVYDKLREDSNCSILCAAVEATGWNKELSIPYDTVYQEEGGYEVHSRSYTLLGVSDADFRKDNINSFDDLVGRLKAGSDYTSETNALYQYVSYHILPGSYTLSDLREMSGSDTSRIWETYAENQVIMITVDTTARDWQLNLLDESIRDTRFDTLSCNVQCKNGYIQSLDAWLPVWEPVPTALFWDFADNQDVRNMVLAAGNEYQPAEPVSTESNTVVYKCFDYYLSESGASNSYFVTYRTCKKQLKECAHYDRLVINLGYMGKLSLESPTIVKGKYKVELRFVYLSDHSFMRTLSDGNGGMIRINFDGENEKSVAPYTEVTKSSMCTWVSTLYDEITFDATTSHTFSFTIMDPSASTNSKFSLQFDGLIFTPIE